MSGTEPVIDIHVHHYTDDYLEALESATGVETYRREKDGRFVALWNDGVALTVPQPHPTLAQRIDMMDQVGIARQVLSVPSPNSYFLEPRASAELAQRTNEAFAAIVRDHPDRFDFIAMTPLGDVDLAVATTDTALDDLGAKGLMLLTNVDGVPLDDARFEPFWRYADARKLLIHVHPTVPVAGGTLADHALAISVGFFADTNLAIARMAYSGVFERYPGIRWIFSHLGGTLPFMLPRLDNYWKQFPAAHERSPRPPSAYIKELLFDTATTHEPAIRCATETLGQERLVFGSDYPHVPGDSGPFLVAAEAVGVGGADREALLWGRAERLLAGEAV